MSEMDLNPQMLICISSSLSTTLWETMYKGTFNREHNLQADISPEKEIIQHKTFYFDEYQSV